MSNLADRMKMYELLNDQILMPKLPICCRIDGKCFSQFTRGLARPYDEGFQKLMDETTKFLVNETAASVGYVQSDEISLVFYQPNPSADPFFGGKVRKLNSVLASMATAFFNVNVHQYLPQKAGKMAYFDCRVWNVPSLAEAVNSLIWREQDATKNSISMAARSVYSHKECDHKNGSDLQEMLFAKGINWNDYPARFKRGAYFRRVLEKRKFTASEISQLPEKHLARVNPEIEIMRSVVKQIEIEPLTKYVNPWEVLTQGAEPIKKTDSEKGEAEHQEVLQSESAGMS